MKGDGESALFFFGDLGRLRISYLVKGGVLFIYSGDHSYMEAKK